MMDSLSSSVLAALVTAALSLVVTVIALWLQRRYLSQKLRVKIGSEEVSLADDDIDETLREIEDKVRFLQEHPRVFLAYAHVDSDFARRLAHDLRSHGISVTNGYDEIRVGDSLPQKILEAIASSQWIVMILSENSEKSEWVALELQWALNAEKSRQRPLIVPILYRGSSVPRQLADRVYADFRESYDDGLSNLLNGLKRTSPHG